MSGVWQVRVDTGGTFTDAWALSPQGEERRCKLLSDGRLRVELGDPDSEGWRRLGGLAASWSDGLLVGWTGAAGLEVTAHQQGRIQYQGRGGLVEFDGGEEAPVVAARVLLGVAKSDGFPPVNMRVATTRGTNALLEKKGAKVALFVNRGMGDLLQIRDQRRESLFGLQQPPYDHLAHQVYEIGGRLTAEGVALNALNEVEVRRLASQARAEGCDVAAVSLMHAWRSSEHECQVVAWLREEGFDEVTASSSVAPLIRVLPRTETALADAFLAPVMRGFVQGVAGPLGQAELYFMTSAGGLVPADRYHPKDSLLSGPAGGLIGAAQIGISAGYPRLLTFDMGGTSTDVARLDGPFQYRTEQQIGPARVVAPALRIETVAAGGGSICQWRYGRLEVGPESAGSDPGPACYGRGGPLTLTDVNLLLGLMDPGKAGIPLDRASSEARFDELIAIMERDGESVEARAQLLGGLRGIAIETMAEAIRSVSLREGVEVRGHALLAFGGAGPQHATAVADRLGVTEVLVPADAGLLSAWGLERALKQEQAVKQVLLRLNEVDVQEVWNDLATEVRAALGLEDPHFRWMASMRLQGQESALDVESSDGDPHRLQSHFEEAYLRTFGYPAGVDRVLEVVSLRVIGESSLPPIENESFGYEAVEGPTLLQDRFSTCVVPVGWQMRNGTRGTLLLSKSNADNESSSVKASGAVLAGLFRSRFEGILGAMGESLKRTAVSTNVKDRMDYSCALLNTDGFLVSSAPHVPVHLGALGVCVREVCSRVQMNPGDVVITNDPGAGGSHLPDVTVIAPVHDATGCLIGYVANRAHHAEIGGLAPGSMPAHAKCLAEEGVVIRPMKLVDAGVPQLESFEKLLSGGAFPSRRPSDNIADAEAQLAACHFARDALRELADTHGSAILKEQLDGVIENSGRLMEARLAASPFERVAKCELDDGSPLQVSLRSVGGRLHVDFSGSSEVHRGNLNATPAIVRSVLLYVLRLWLGDDVPLNEGLLEPVDVLIPRGMLNPDFSGSPEDSPAVVGGNVETSQRLADLLLEALEVSANGQGTMNNFLFGNDEFGYYETLAGGSGAGPNHQGASGRHVHMTNTALTDPELMEQRYPVRVWNHSLRVGSGGKGRHRGGDGIVREIEFLRPVTVSFLTQRRTSSPNGMGAGGEGLAGKQTRIYPDAAEESLDGIVTYAAKAGERVRIETPGGGGWEPAG